MRRPIEVPYAINVTSTTLTIASTDTAVRGNVSYSINDVTIAAADTDTTHVTIKAHEDDATTVDWRIVTNIVPVSRADFISQVQALVDTELANASFTTLTVTGASTLASVSGTTGTFTGAVTADSATLGTMTVSAAGALGGTYTLGVRDYMALIPGAMGTLTTSFTSVDFGYGQEASHPSPGQRAPSDTEDFILTHVGLVIDDDVAIQTDIEVRVEKNGIVQFDQIDGPPITNVGGGLITLQSPVTYAPGDYMSFWLKRGPSGSFGSECRMQPIGYFAR